MLEQLKGASGILTALLLLLITYILYGSPPTPPSQLQLMEESTRNISCAMPHLSSSNASNNGEDISAWIAILDQCGRNVTAALLSQLLKLEANKFMNEFYAPFALQFPSLLSGVIHGPQRTVYSSTKANIDQADAARCWHFASTGEFKCLPSLIIIGAQRASSKELYDWLKRNPSTVAYGSPITQRSSETHYFDSLQQSSKFHALQPLRRGGEPLSDMKTSWYTNYLVESPGISLEEVVRGKRFLFEKTPAYLDQTDPALIAKLLPSIKLLVSLREPAARLWSAYWRRCDRVGADPNACSMNHFVKTHLVPAEFCVSQAWELSSDECLAQFSSGYHLRAILLGRYQVYIQRYIHAFAHTRGKLLVMFAEEFARDPFQTMEEIEAYCAPNLKEAFDYKSLAKLDSKSNMYVLPATSSKALQAKPRGYIPFNNLPVSVRERMSALYVESNRDLKRLLLAESEGKEVFIQLSKHWPAWFNDII